MEDEFGHEEGADFVGGDHVQLVEGLHIGETAYIEAERALGERLDVAEACEEAEQEVDEVGEDDASEQQEQAADGDEQQVPEEFLAVGGRQRERGDAALLVAQGWWMQPAKRMWMERRQPRA